MKRNDTTFKEMVSRIQSGELTRNQASEAYNVKRGTLDKWLNRSRIATPPLPKALYGAALTWVKDDPVRAAALKAAIDDVLTNHTSLDQVIKKYPGVARSTVAVEVRKVLASQGIKRKSGYQHKTP